MANEYYKTLACDILYSSGDPEKIDKEFIENVVATLLEKIEHLEIQIKDVKQDLRHHKMWS